MHGWQLGRRATSILLPTDDLISKEKAISSVRNLFVELPGPGFDLGQFKLSAMEGGVKGVEARISGSPNSHFSLVIQKAFNSSSSQLQQFSWHQ